ncbi:hypothetical protein LINPERPRIM_LOCUS5920 [Linum perenne]
MLYHTCRTTCYIHWVKVVWDLGSKRVHLQLDSLAAVEAMKATTTLAPNMFKD